MYLDIHEKDRNGKHALFSEVYEFADKIAKLTNMNIIDKSKESRVVLLG